MACKTILQFKVGGKGFKGFKGGWETCMPCVTHEVDGLEIAVEKMSPDGGIAR